MAKFNFHSLKRPEKKVKNFIISAPHNPGVEIPLSIIEPNMADILRIDEIQEHYVDFYLKPDKTTGETPSILVDMKEEKPNERIILLCSSIYCLQYVEKEEDKLSLEEIFILLFTMEDAMMELTTYVSSIVEEFQRVRENPTEAVDLPQLEQSLNQEQLTLSI